MPTSPLQSWPREQLIEEIQNLRRRKKYGIVWEDKKEDVVEQCKTQLPVLRELKNKAIAMDENGPVNILIEGDNFHALSVLNYTHKGKIDVIYIDPPYNTGNKSWKYNNRYVEKEDAYRHSKFLSFLSKRVRLSKSLLTNRGIMVCAIDDYEHQNVRHLLDEVFGENNRLGTIAVVHNPGGRQDDKYFATAHEYMLVYAKNKDLARVGHLEISDRKLAEYKFEDKFGRYKLRDYRRSGANSRPQDRPNLWYPIYIDPQTLDIQTRKRPGHKELLPIDPGGEKRVWRWNAETLMENKEKYIEVKRNGKSFTLLVKERLDDNKGQKPKTFWNEPYYSSSVGTAELKNILGTRFKGEKIFDFPKSKFLIRDILEIISGPNSVILDFFAGSGTTAQSVLELNKRRKANHRFILCTNDESGICENVCYPRIANVITGYKTPNGIKMPGLGGNLKYFRTSFVGAEPNDRNKEALTKQAAEMLCVREDTFDLVKETSKIKIYRNSERHTGILFNENAIPELKKYITRSRGPWSVYIFSLSDDTFEGVFDDLKQKITVAPIPEAILRVYRRIFKP
jgi:adenine-specific DNA-methyltransferase